MSYIQYAIYYDEESAAKYKGYAENSITLRYDPESSVKQVINQDTVKTIECKNKLMKSNLGIGDKVLTCNQKIMKSNVIVKAMVTSGPNYKIYTEPGTFIVPPGVSSINLFVVGGGGGGNGGASRTNGLQGGAGGGGGYCNTFTIPVQESEVFYVTAIGSGGVGVETSLVKPSASENYDWINSAGNGGTSSVTREINGATYSASGGQGAIGYGRPMQASGGSGGCGGAGGAHWSSHFESSDFEEYYAGISGSSKKEIGRSAKLGELKRGLHPAENICYPGAGQSESTVFMNTGYAGGGGGGSYRYDYSLLKREDTLDGGGLGGCDNRSYPETSGTPNSGGGGGGSCGRAREYVQSEGSRRGGDGGSGVVIFQW